MNWFKQNRALSTLLVVFGVCILFAGGLLYWRWATWRDARQTFDQVAAEKNRLDHLDPFPNESNYKKLQGYLDHYNTALEDFKKELGKQIAPAPPLAPNEFQSRLRQATVATLSRAQTNNVKLPDKFQMGFDEFAMSLPPRSVAPLLGQELSQVQMLLNILLDAKVDSVTSFHRAALPEEHTAASTPTPSPAAGRAGTAAKTATPAPALLKRNVVELTFKATPAAARKVLNEIVNSSGQFFI
ncbi:MAG TPA: Amuc_1100 family pilus-like protein, partial [Candidatus Udaeobacter sp.]|nr:Amuc_1100 family pilus-like protein [Candidatus Udaeobacter sp.]